MTKLDVAAPPPPPPPPPPPSCLSTKILITYADNGNEPEMIRNALLAEPGVTAVDLFDGSNGTPTLTRLLGYKIVMAFGGSGWLHPAEVGDVLADYMDAGGVVVATTFVWDIQTAELRGRYMTGGYTPFNTTNAEAFSWATLGTYDADHSVMAGVTMLSAFGRNDLTLTSGADLIASWSDGVLAIATKNRTVGINAYLGYTNEWSGQFARVTTNTGKWICGRGPPPPPSTAAASATSASTSTSARARHSATSATAPPPPPPPLPPPPPPPPPSTSATATPPPPPVVRCVVPRVIGLTLRKARTRIRARHCSVGRIRRARSRRVGRVIARARGRAGGWRAAAG